MFVICLKRSHIHKLCPFLVFTTHDKVQNETTHFCSGLTENLHVYQVTAPGSAATAAIYLCWEDLVQIPFRSLPAFDTNPPPQNAHTHRPPPRTSAAILYMIHFTEKDKRLLVQIDFSGSNNPLH